MRVWLVRRIEIAKNAIETDERWNLEHAGRPYGSRYEKDNNAC